MGSSQLEGGTSTLLNLKGSQWGSHMGSWPGGGKRLRGKIQGMFSGLEQDGIIPSQATPKKGRSSKDEESFIRIEENPYDRTKKEKTESSRVRTT